MSGVRQRLVEEGLEAALNRKRQKNRGSRPPKLDGAGEARLIALACGPPPEGRARWTLQLLADKVLELGVIDEPISYQTVWERLRARQEITLQFSPDLARPWQRCSSVM